MVFILDHLDGTTNYTELKDGRPRPFDTSSPHPTVTQCFVKVYEGVIKHLKFWHDKVDIRVNEVKGLIDEI